MDILHNRLKVESGFTFGSLWIEDKFQVFTKERGIARADNFLVCGESLPPAGRYNVQIVHSKRYDQLMPLMMCTGTSDGYMPRVGFYLHPGHQFPEVVGSVVVGQTETKTAKHIGHTKAAFDFMFGRIMDRINAGEAVNWEIA